MIINYSIKIIPNKQIIMHNFSEYILDFRVSIYMNNKQHNYEFIDERNFQLNHNNVIRIKLI